MKRFDIGVVPSDSEGFPNVILEYMALSVPVVATDVGGNTELIQQGDNGLLVPPNNAVALASAIETLFDDHGLRAHIAANARMKVQKEFNWPAQIRQIEDFYREVIVIEPSLSA
jgi:glycosyltransferase involved in cell wall biosynthesis